MVQISGGTIDITASDDGINAAGGTDESAAGGRFGNDSFASSGYYSIDITGGDVNLYTKGDGIDSNGDITISDGNILVIINSSADNDAIDCDGTFTAAGGNIIYGGTGAGTSPQGGSTQSYLYTSDGISAGSELNVQQNGSTLLSFTLEHDAQYLAVSTPEITNGEDYDLYNGSSLLTTLTAGTGEMGGMGGRGGQNGAGKRPDK